MLHCGVVLTVLLAKALGVAVLGANQASISNILTDVELIILISSIGLVPRTCLTAQL
jgi:hypothetical protein